MDSRAAGPVLLPPLMLTLDGVVEGVALTNAVVLFDAAYVADEPRVLVQVVIVSVDDVVIVAFLTLNELELELVIVVTLTLDEVLVISSADEVDEVEADEVVDVLGVSETRPPVTLYAAAQATRSRLSGQHQVSPLVSAVQ